MRSRHSLLIDRANPSAVTGLIDRANPSAVTGHSEAYDDLVGTSGSGVNATFTYVSDNAGLLEVSEYYGRDDNLMIFKDTYRAHTTPRSRRRRIRFVTNCPMLETLLTGCSLCLKVWSSSTASE